MKASRALTILLLSAVAAGCGSGSETPRRGQEAIERIFANGFRAPIVDARGKPIGTLAGAPGDQGLVVRIAASELKPGRHAIHLHEEGRCDLPDFASAGAHWNAAGRQHGHDNPRGPHDGDWDNMDVGADGRGSTDRLIPRWHGRIPPSGLALVIHADRDDEVTDPSGNSGVRIACGIVIPPA